MLVLGHAPAPVQCTHIGGGAPYPTIPNVAWYFFHFYESNVTYKGAEVPAYCPRRYSLIQARKMWKARKQYLVRDYDFSDLVPQVLASCHTRSAAIVNELMSARF